MPSREIERRLDALEEQRGIANQDAMRINRIIIAPGTNGPEQLPIMGWQCGDIETRRLQDESENDCWERHNAAIDAEHGKDAVVMSVQLTGDD